MKRGNEYSYDNCKLINKKEISQDKPRKFPYSLKKKLRMSASSFNFKNHCFICGLDI